MPRLRNTFVIVSIGSALVVGAGCHRRPDTSASPPQLKQTEANEAVAGAGSPTLPAPPTTADGTAKSPSDENGGSPKPASGDEILQAQAEARKLGEQDPAKAFALLAASIPPERLAWQEEILAEFLGGQDFNKIPLLLSLLPDASSRDGTLRSVTNDWVAKDPQAFLKFAKASLGPAEQGAVFSQVAYSMAVMSRFSDAIAIVDQMTPGSRARQKAQNGMLQAWAASDAGAAVDWLLTRSKQEQQSALKNGLFTRMKKVADIEQILKVVESTTDPRFQNEGIGRAVDILLESHQTEAAKAWIDKLPPSLQSAAQLAIVQHDQKASVADLTPMALSIADQANRSAAIGELVDRAFAKDPGDATIWIQALPTADNQSDALCALMAQWSNVDFTAEKQWVDSLPKGKFKDLATRVYKDYQRQHPSTPAQ